MAQHQTCFVRCPRCLKRWWPYSVYFCTGCGSMFCACCDLDVPPDAKIRWLDAAARDLLLRQCPICNVAIDFENCVGFIGDSPE